MIRDKIETERYTLYLADALEVLPILETGSVVSMVTDPPYGVGFSGKMAVQRGGGQKKAIFGYSTFDDTPENIAEIIVPAIKIALSLVRRAAITPGTRNMFKYPDPADVGCFFSPAGTGVGKWGFTCSQPILFYGKCPYLEYGLGSRANSLGQTYPNDANKVGHPCAKPLPQILWLVGRATALTDTVLDPFMGSGTTGVACMKLGRRFVGIEIDPAYFAIAAKRIAKAAEEPPLFKAAREAEQMQLAFGS